MILIIDNYDSFTWNLVHRLGELDPSLRSGGAIHVARHDQITPDQAEALNNGRGPTHLVISPGPCTPAHAGVSSAMIDRFAGRIPILGVCLGHQCLGHLHGMNIIRHARAIHGKTSFIHHDGRGLFAGLPNPMLAARYHSLVIDPSSIPACTPGHDGWEVSAWTTDVLDDGTEVRVVMGLRRVWADPARAPLDGVQFHPESFMTEDGPRLLRNFLAGASTHALSP